jgi:D-alanyl-D-alanine carboxypeptidase
MTISSPHRATKLAGACLIACAAIALLAVPAGASSLRQDLHRLTRAGVPGTVALVRDGDRTRVLTDGVADLRTRRAPSANTRFRIGSVTKPYVATVVLQLVQEGRLSLDDTVERWLPGAVPAGDQVSVRHLLGHRSGLYDFFDDPRHMEPYLNGDFAFAWTPSELVGLATSHNPVFAPGERYGYSNTNTVIAGLIVEAVTGNDLGAELRTRLFAPLHLRRTTFATGQGMARPFAHGYLVTDAGLQDVTRVRPTHTWASGNIVSTAPEVARFFHALNSGRLLSAPLLAQMRNTAPLGHGSGVGLGVMSQRYACRGTFIGHDGAMAGYKSEARERLDGSRQFVLLTNSLTLHDEAGGPAAVRAYERVMQHLACG